MTLRFGSLYVGGVYHVFNRGVDKRLVFLDSEDYTRFLELLEILNSTDNIVSVSNYKKGSTDKRQPTEEKNENLVNIIAYSLQNNHYHLLLEQNSEGGVSTFMHKLGTAYTKYFNYKYDRTGALFQGKYRYIETKSDVQVMRLVCYINANDQIHSDRSPTSISNSSRLVYMKKKEDHIVSSVFVDEFVDYEKQEQSVIAEIKETRKNKQEEGLHE